MDCIVWNRGVLYMDSILCGRGVLYVNCMDGIEGLVGVLYVDYTLHVVVE